MDRARESLDFERGAGVAVNADEVPENLRHLIPFVQHWALPGSGPQMVFIEYLEENSPAEIDAFCRAMQPCVDEIRAWIRKSVVGVTAQNIVDQPQAQFHFGYALSAYALAKPVNPDLIAREREKAAAHARDERRKQDIADAADAFRAGRYGEVVLLLEPHESQLSGVERRKLELARNRQS
jgi:hypothetical protein